MTAAPLGRGRMRVWVDGVSAGDLGEEGSGAAIAVIDAFKKEGFTRFSLAVDPKAAK